MNGGLLAIQLLDLEISPADFERLFAGADAVNLERDEALGGHVVLEIDGRHVVDRGLDRIAAALDAKLVPLALLESLAGGLVVREVGEEDGPAGFVVDGSRVGPRRGINLDLVAVHA